MTTWKFDLHNHVNGDPQDNIVHSAEDLIQKAAEEDYSAIALTPHLHQLSWDSAQEKAQDLGILLIEGVEITLQGRHILVLGMDPKDTEDIQNPAELHELKAKYQGEALIIAPHPYYIIANSLNHKFWEWSSLFDAVEITRLNCPLTQYFNARAALEAAKHGLPVVANSDSHALEDFGSCHSLSKERKEHPPTCKEELFEEILAFKTIPICPVLPTRVLLKKIMQLFLPSFQSKHK